MAAKRKAEHVHPSRQGQVPAEPAQKRIKRHATNGKPFKKKAHPVNELKSQIRSLKRLLSRNERLPADVRVEKERELQTAQRELDAAGSAQARSDMIGRYHKTRFFDRQKATKRLKRARKELAAFDESGGKGEEREDLAKRVEDATVDVNYAKYYPLDRHYVSLFPRKKTIEKEKGYEGDDNGDGDGDDASTPSGQHATQREREGDPEMWQQVKQSGIDGTLDALRNGKLLPFDSSTKPLKRAGMNDHQTRHEAPAAKAPREAAINKSHEEMEDDDSDGGFFE